MGFIETDEQVAIRETVRRIAGDFGYDYWASKTKAGEHTTELWQALGQADMSIGLLIVVFILVTLVFTVRVPLSSVSAEGALKAELSELLDIAGQSPARRDDQLLSSM